MASNISGDGYSVEDIITQDAALATQTGVESGTLRWLEESMRNVAGTGVLAAVVATDTFSIDGIAFTAIASGATGNQFNVGGSDAITAANLAATINASVTGGIKGVVSAAAVGTKVTITCLDGATHTLTQGGNHITLVSAWAYAVALLQAGTPQKLQPSSTALAGWQAFVTTRASKTGAASVTATLSGVVATDKLTVGGVDFTAVAASPGANQFLVGASNTATASTLADAINASTTKRVAGDDGLGGPVYAVARAAVVFVFSTMSGVAGNGIPVTQTGGHITLSAAALAGGLDSTLAAY
jgi:hypothetical protein